MKFTSKIVKVGTSNYLLIPSNIKNMLSLVIGDIVEVDIVKFAQACEATNLPDTNFRCSLCNCDFDDNKNNTDIYCPLCGNENKETLIETEKIKTEEINDENKN